MFHKHKWELTKKGSFIRYFFCDTLFYCKCGEIKREEFTYNFKDAGYTEEEYLELIKSLQR